MEKIVPDQLKRRKSEDAEEELEEEQVCHGGFVPWQAVAAAQDISFGHILGVRLGTPGIVVGNSSDDHHVTVKFDKREDDSDLCVDVLPAHLMKPLPGNFRLGQKVMACVDLHLNGALVVPLGCVGTIIGPAAGTAESTEFLLILFEERLDGMEGYVAVHHPMILPHRLLVGGYRLGQKVLCNRDLIVNGQLLVSTDTPGKIVGEYSDTRLTVAFDAGENNQNQEGYESHCVFNVQPAEIRTFRNSPWNIRPGDTVRATSDLGANNFVLVLAGTRGIVHTCVDEMRIIVAFEGNLQHGTSPQLLTVGGNSIEKDVVTTSEKVRTLTDYAGLAVDASPNEIAAALAILGLEQRRRLAQICKEMVEEHSQSIHAGASD